jgi:predicted transglutaminase-like cysteine proteinase
MRKPASALFALSFVACAATELLAESAEPFGLIKIVAPEGGQTVLEWRKLMANVGSARRELEQCRSEPDRCNDAERQFVALVKKAASLQGRAKIEFVNERINGEIRYTSDNAQWGTDDIWSLPIDASKEASLETGKGDCEDYALAKYVALHQAGVPDEKLRMVLVHDNFVDQDHAVLAVREDDKWLILDNRWSKPVEDKELTPRFKPLFIVEKTGVSLLARSFRLNDRMVVAPRNRPAAPAAGP